MLKCEGYQMFKGVMRITPKSDKFPIRDIEATWLYKPEYDCWYGKGASYPAVVCTIIEDRTKEV